MRILRTSVAVTALSLLGVAFAGAPAGAATRVPVVAAANTQSTGFAGYAVAGAAGAAVKSASSSFTLPSVTCAKTGNTGVVAITQIFDATGTTSAVGGIFIVCESGTLVFQSLLQINGHSPATFKFTPAAKDKITITVSQSATAAKVTIKDVTQAKSQSYSGLAGSVAGTDVNSNIGMGAVTLGGAAVGNPPFGTITFSKDLTNGVAIAGLPHTAFNEATAATGGTLQILTSAVSATTGFKTTFKHA